MNKDSRSYCGVVKRQKQAWPEMGYLARLNMSAAFPFTWKVKQCGCCVRDRVKSPLQGLRGLSGPGEKPYEQNLKKCLLQTTQSRAPHVQAVFWGCKLVSSIYRRDSVSKRPTLAQLLLSSSTCGLQRKPDSINAYQTHKTNRCENEITAFTLLEMLWLGLFFFIIPAQHV